VTPRGPCQPLPCCDSVTGGQTSPGTGGQTSPGSGDTTQTNPSPRQCRLSAIGSFVLLPGVSKPPALQVLFFLFLLPSSPQRSAVVSVAVVKPGPRQRINPGLCQKRCGTSVPPEANPAALLKVPLTCLVTLLHCPSTSSILQPKARFPSCHPPPTRIPLSYVNIRLSSQGREIFVESSRLEKTSKIIESNHHPNTPMPAQPCPKVPHPHVF